MLRTANALLCENPETEIERFCTACCAIIRADRSVRATIASAGHPLPILLRSGQTPEEIQCKGGLLGVTADLDLRSQRVTLHPGDRVLLYTDGVTEARDGDGGFFGDHEFAKMLAANADAGAEEVVEQLLRAVARYSGGPPRDDLALLALGVSGD
jgi:serine phosphatase RsbU (regulator of sigma subunit)